MKRRKFIENSALATTGLFASPNIISSTLYNKSVDPIRVGVIGSGDRGGGLIKLLQQFPEFAVTAVSDVLDFRLEKAIQNAAPNAKSFTDYRKILDDQDIDAVIIATPLSMHHKMAVEALDAGKHVYCEKTMTFHIDEALDLVKKVDAQKNLVFQVGHQYRYLPLYHKIATMIQRGALGEVSNIYIQWNRNGDWRRPVPKPEYEKLINWRMYNEFSGGLTAELHSHQIDYVNWIFNAHPEKIAGFGGIDYWKDGRETFDNVNTLLKYENGIKVNLVSLTTNSRNDYLIEFKGTKGTIQMGYNTAKVYWQKPNNNIKGDVDGVSGATLKLIESGEPSILTARNSVPDWEGSHYAIQEFHKCIVEGKQPISNVRTGARTAICVRLAIDAMTDNTVKTWHASYEV